MKHVGALMVALMAAAGVARAEGSLAAMGSYWNPDSFEDTIGYGGKLLMGGKTFGLEVRGSYFDSLQQNDGKGTLDLQVIPVEVGLVLRAGGQELIPYLGGGASYCFLEGNTANDESFEVDDEVGWYAVGGLELSLGKSTAVFGEAQYRKITGTAHDDSVEDITGDVDIDLSGLVVNVGFAIRF